MILFLVDESSIFNRNVVNFLSYGFCNLLFWFLVITCNTSLLKRLIYIHILNIVSSQLLKAYPNFN
jgi:hypothetical protein